MIGIKIKSTFLDIYDKTTIGFELNSPLYFSDDVDIVQGSYSFPISIPLTVKNRIVLEYPDLIENDKVLMKDEPVEVWSNGIGLFSGLAYVKTSTDRQCSLYILVDSLSPLKTKGLNELPLGATNLGSSPAFVLQNMKLTTIYPDSFNHIFFPVWNPYFHDDKSGLGFDHQTFQNPWLNASHAFTAGTIGTNYAVTPFVKLNYVLQKMFESQGFTLMNNWQITRELKQLVLYNNFSLCLNGFINPFVDYTNHVSNTKSSEFLRKLKGLFNLGIFVNYFDKKTEIIPAKDLLTRPCKHNWTKVAEAAYSKSMESNLNEQFAYSDPLNNIIPDLSKLQVFKFASLPTDTDAEGIYYVSDIQRFIYHKPIVGAIPAVNIHVTVDDAFDVYKDHPNASTDNFDLFVDSRRSQVLRTYSNGLKTLPSNRVFFGSTSGVPGYIPAINQKGFYDDPRVPVDDILLFYRGTRGDFGIPWSYPVASSELTDMTGANFRVGWAATGTGAPSGTAEPVNSAYSLHWKDEDTTKPNTGLYRAWWDPWIDMLNRAKYVQRRVFLSEVDLLNFSFKDKVRIGNMEYFVQNIRVSLSNQGLQPCEVNLVSVV
jgi:hypothetical protein